MVPLQLCESLRRKFRNSSDCPMAMTLQLMFGYPVHTTTRQGSTEKRGGYREKAALRITSSASVWAGNKSSVTFPLSYVAGNSIVTSVLAEEAVKSSKFMTLSNIRDMHTGRESSLGKQAAELGRGVSKHLWCRKTMFISAHKLTQTLASWRCEPEQSRTISKRDVAIHDSRGEQGYRKELC